jgi:hypothetical protein
MKRAPAAAAARCMSAVLVQRAQWQCMSPYQRRWAHACTDGLSSAATAAAIAADPPTPAPRIAPAAPGCWALRTASPSDRLIAIVDGTNVAMSCRPRTRGISGDGVKAGVGAAAHASRFRAWLRFLRAATNADVTLVAFDNKGSVGGNARATLHPGYNRARYGRGQQAGG